MTLERPVDAGSTPARWGSDAVAALLRALDLPYVCLNPGASYRGLHDSLVNFLGNERPQVLLCLHEEHAVAIAHGYAKVTGRPLGALVHSNVGLLHASMAIFNAWCDRVPVLVLGATGPVDAARRRPWIDWIHTAADQAALVRPYLKWDNQPASIPAALESLLRADLLARTAPCGPVYVCLDASLQEAPLLEMPALPDVGRFRPAPPAAPPPAQLAEAARRLREARRPVILAGRASRDAGAWRARVALAERVGATVLTDLKAPAAFPTAHPLHGAPPGYFLTPPAAARLREADVVLSLDWIDLAGTLRQAWGGAPVSATIVQVSADHHVHHGFAMDHQALPPADLWLPVDPDAALPALLEALGPGSAGAEPREAGGRAATPAAAVDGDALDLPALAGALRHAVAGLEPTLVRVPLGWSGELWDVAGPLDYLGGDGGGGIGSGPGMAVGAALALQGSGRLPVAVLGDGDFLMGVTALWTAAHYRIPLLVVVANNRSYFNDELHQERVARERGRPVANRWIGQRIADPEVDLAAMARAQGLVGLGPVASRPELPLALARAVAVVREGAPCVVDVHVRPGYGPAMTQAMARGAAPR
ncbi:MAG: thiamine pyrophosphate-binding protein [Candidatus Rokubacteria bacterium]|nr:thiamine pyrophosphate-binding protein [Candidatus Rokubacteria bacterium]